MASDGAGLIGRDGERALLRGLADPPPVPGDGRSRVLVLLGDAGAGKTVLLDEAARLASAAGFRVLSAAGRESEQNLAFAGLHQLLRPVLSAPPPSTSPPPAPPPDPTPRSPRASRIPPAAPAPIPPAPPAGGAGTAGLAGLPVRQAEALRGAFGLDAEPVAPDPLLTGLAVLTLLSELASARPLLVVVDDAQWLDRGSLDALSFAGHRLGSEAVVLLLGVRGSVPPAGFQRDFAELVLPPLGLRDAERLLGTLPRPPRGLAREQVLAQSAGNPLALIELSRAIAADPAAGRRWAAEPLPLTDRLTALLAAQFRALSGPSQTALLLAAVADSADVPAAGLPGLSAGVLAPAEEAGLIRAGAWGGGGAGAGAGVVAGAGAGAGAGTRPGPRFTHPLVRSAVYHAVPFADRAAAHLRVASVLRGQPDRYAWHRAAAALEPDEQVAALLEETAEVAQRRGGAAAAARALERAAQLSPAEPERARRLLAAAGLARQAGQADWVRDLCHQVLTLTEDPGRRLAARMLTGWALVWSDQHAEALATLLAVAADQAGPSPRTAGDALGLAATVAYQTGGQDDRNAVLAAMEQILVPDGEPDAGSPATPVPHPMAGTPGAAPRDSLGHQPTDHPAGQPGTAPTASPGLPATAGTGGGPRPGGYGTGPWVGSGGFPGEHRLWILACAGSPGQRAGAVPALRRIAAGTVADPALVGAAAWLLDDTELAVRLLREAINRLRSPGVRSASGAALSALQWACLDSGRWDETLSAASEASDAAAAYKMESVAASADLAAATVLVLRGDHDAARPLLARAGATVDAAGYRAFAARARHAAGLSALAEGRFADAYTQLSQLFGTRGQEPLHHHVSFLGVADLAAAAARDGRRREARTLLGRALSPAGAGAGAGPRLAQLAARARGLLAAPADAEPHFAAALAGPAGATWPFERAQAQLDYGEWLRRQRRINDAKPVLAAALETFRRLGAAPWSGRAEAELRACGVTTVPAPGAGTSDGGAAGARLAALTPQQREIVILASQGLTNGEIGDRLYLSPRTVASHLYRSYPKLGIAGRHQLAALVARASG